MKWWGSIGLGFVLAAIPFVLAAVWGILAQGIRENYQRCSLRAVDWLYLIIGGLLIWSAWR